MKNLLITVLLLLAAYSNVNAQCKASYIYNQNGKTIAFYDSSFVNQANPTYYWSFGDGTTSTGQYVTHSYSNYGTYFICHGVTSANCADTICDSIVIAAPRCQTLFKDYTSGTATYFYNSSTSISGTASYFWDFGDTSNSTVEHPSHYYAASGNYTVCLYMKDSIGGCSDSLCQNISVTHGGNGNGTCSALYKFYGQNTTYYFNGPFNANGGTYSSYFWDFGDGTSSTQQSPSHAYNFTGNAYVCLTVKDSGCTDTYCDSLYSNPNGGGNCSVYFTDSIYGDTANFTTFIKGTSGTVNYTWDFGDGSNSTQQNPTHIYAVVGYYYVTLAIADSSCSSSYSAYVQIGGSGNNNGRYYIAGQISAGNTYAYPAMVWAINYDSAAGTLTGVDSTMTDSGGYYYFKLNKGYYLIKAALYNANGGSSNYMPTYYINKLNWDSATQLQVDTDYYNININLLAGNFAGGPGFIGGKTSQGANKTGSVGDPVNQVQINLMDVNKNSVAYTYSDANGDFKFQNIAYGTYYIHPEIPGKKSNDIQVTINAGNPSANTVFIEVNKKYVSASLTAIKRIDAQSGIEFWPNPANDIIYIKSNNIISNIYITDITGKRVLEINKLENAINVSSLDAGLYIMQIRTKDGMVVPYKFVKQ
ncbi:MAG: PKD domain-containing protein [Bacteroidota bacterium]|nr:PKD domain-containing protein [Bacteroidota bacterium]